MHVPSHKSHSNMLLSHLNEYKHFIYMRELIGCDINTFSQFKLQTVEGDHRIALSMKLVLRNCCIYQSDSKELKTLKTYCRLIFLVLE